MRDIINLRLVKPFEGHIERPSIHIEKKFALFKTVHKVINKIVELLVYLELKKMDRDFDKGKGIQLKSIDELFK